jgi:hypothetical protein
MHPKRGIDDLLGYLIFIHRDTSIDLSPRRQGRKEKERKESRYGTRQLAVSGWSK